MKLNVLKQSVLPYKRKLDLIHGINMRRFAPADTIGTILKT